MVRSFGPLFKAAFILCGAVVIFSVLNPEYSVMPGSTDAPADVRVENYEPSFEDEADDEEPEALDRVRRYRMEADFEAGYQAPEGCTDGDLPAKECQAHRDRLLAEFERLWIRRNP